MFRPAVGLVAWAAAADYEHGLDRLPRLKEAMSFELLSAAL
jgi:hypothetical protein